MRLKAQNEMAGLLPHAAMGPVERMVRPQSLGRGLWTYFAAAGSVPTAGEPSFSALRSKIIVLPKTSCIQVGYV